MSEKQKLSIGWSCGVPGHAHETPGDATLCHYKSERIAWVIETGNGLFWLSAHKGHTGNWMWSHKIDEALQFSRKEDAETLWRYVQKHLRFFGIGVPDGSEVRQHAFYEEAQS